MSTFMDELKAKATKEDKVFLTAPKIVEVVVDRYIDSDEEEEPKEEVQSELNTHVLWLSNHYKSEYEAFEESCATDNPCASFKAELEKAKKEKKGDLPKLLETCLALTRYMSEDIDWMTKDTKASETLVKQLAQYWRQTLLKKQDKAIGLDEKGRAALYVILDQCRTKLDLDGEGGLFNFQPAEKKKTKK